MQVTIILVKVPVPAMQSPQCNDDILKISHLSFDLERDLLLRFSFLSLSLSLSLCRSLSRLHGSSRKPHAMTMALETLSTARGQDVLRLGGLGLPIMICVGHDAGGFLLWQYLQGGPRGIARDSNQHGGCSSPHDAAGNMGSKVGLSQNWPADCGLWAMSGKQPRRKLRNKRVSHHGYVRRRRSPSPPSMHAPQNPTLTSRPDRNTRAPLYPH